MAKKPPVAHQEAAAERDAPDGQRVQSRDKGNEGVERIIEKERAGKKAEATAALTDLLAEIPKAKVYAGEVVAELKKVQWPTRKQVRAEVVTVIATVMLLTMLVYGLDRVFTIVSNMVFK